MLFFGLNGIGRTEPDGKVDFKLWDRVVNCRSDCACPLGWRGTVIGIVIAPNPCPIGRSHGMTLVLMTV